MNAKNSKRKHDQNGSSGSVPNWASEVDSWLRGPRRCFDENSIPLPILDSAPESRTRADNVINLLDDGNCGIQPLPSIPATGGDYTVRTSSDLEAEEPNFESGVLRKNKHWQKKRSWAVGDSSSSALLFQTLHEGKEHDQELCKTEFQRAAQMLLKRRALLEQSRLECMESGGAKFEIKLKRLLAKSVAKKSISKGKPAMEVDNGIAAEKLQMCINDRPEFRGNDCRLLRPDSIVRIAKSEQKVGSVSSRSRKDKVSFYQSMSKSLFGIL